MAENILKPRYIASVEETKSRGELVNPRCFVYELMMAKGATKELMMAQLSSDRQSWLGRGISKSGCKSSPSMLKTSSLPVRIGLTGT